MTKKLRIKYAVYIFCMFLAAIFFIANIVVTQEQFIYNTVCSVLGTERRVLVEGDPSQYQYYKPDYGDKASTLAAANALNERIAEEGIILLKNDGLLPIVTPESSKSVTVRPRVSVFGHNSVNLVYGGSGSGGASSKGAATVFDSLTAAGYDYNPALKSFYESSAAGDERDTPSMGDSLLAGIYTGETPVSAYNSAVKNSYKDYNDAAIVVLSRLGGEGFDLPRTSKTSLTDKGTLIKGARNMTDHYLQLDKNEVDMLREVMNNFGNVIIVVNSSEAMELGFLDDPAHYLYTDDGYADSVKARECMNKLKAAVWIGSPGKTGINALGRILNGKVNPSGRTVDTYARDFTKDPSYNNFGTNNVMHGNEYYTVRSNGKLSAREQYLVEYEEGIYVGYRYYETRYVTEKENGDNWYNRNVVFPLGYGLSYTSFEWELINKSEIENTAVDFKTTFNLKVKVKNTGGYAGKDVVQVYLNAPYYDGGIEKSEVVLVGYVKTPLLAAKGSGTAQFPEECTLEIPVKAEYFASYDYNDANKNQHNGYEIEHGGYELRVSRNAHEAVDCAEINVAEDIKISSDAKTDAPVSNLFDDVSGYINRYLSRSDWEGTWPTPPTLEERTVTQAFLDSTGYDGVDGGKPWYTDEMPEQSKKELKYKDTVKLYELIGKDYYEDAELWDELLNQLTVEQMAEMIGTGNYNTMAIENIGKPRTIDPDGPVGFTAFMGDPSVYDTCFYASGCVLGATYNGELAYEMGRMVGNEGIIGNAAGDGTPYSGWYAPAVNIHRSPFGGRNWEYYSEDGYLSGSIAAQVIQGAKSKGVYTYVKHFALNEQETHRSGVLTFANEQAMREIYFRAFELCVKDGETTAIMSSFNRIGNTWTGGSYNLLTKLLREEWGFTGMVITDYNYATPYMNVNQMIRAGGDLNLTQKGWPSTEQTPTQVAALRRATKNILYTVVNSTAMNGYGPGVIYKYVMPMWVVWLLVADIFVLAGVGVYTFFFVRGEVKRRRAKAAKAANADGNPEQNDVDGIVLSDGNVIKNINSGEE